MALTAAYRIGPARGIRGAGGMVGGGLTTREVSMANDGREAAGPDAAARDAAALRAVEKTLRAYKREEKARRLVNPADPVIPVLDSLVAELRLAIREARHDA
jgi:hypothetical protein